MNVPSKYRIYSCSPQSPGLFPDSILPTAFMGTAMIFTCFSLSALYARRRSYLFLGGECGLGNGERVSTLAMIVTRTVSLPPIPQNVLWLLGWNKKHLRGNIRNGFNGIALLWLLSGRLLALLQVSWCQPWAWCSCLPWGIFSLDPFGFSRWDFAYNFPGAICLTLLFLSKIDWESSRMLTFVGQCTWSLPTNS